VLGSFGSKSRWPEEGNTPFARARLGAKSAAAARIAAAMGTRLEATLGC
jgi:hypothetical protein